MTEDTQKQNDFVENLETDCEKEKAKNQLDSKSDLSRTEEQAKDDKTVEIICKIDEKDIMLSSGQHIQVF